MKFTYAFMENAKAYFLCASSATPGQQRVCSDFCDRSSLFKGGCLLIRMRVRFAGREVAKR